MLLRTPRQLLLILICLVHPLIAGAELPVLGDPTQQQFSPYQEYLMGKNFYKALRSNLPFIEDLMVNEYLNNLGQKLISNSDQPDKRYKFFILKIPNINAFAGPDAHIGIHTGLFLSAKNESELAGVLAHEISHVTQRHLARAMTESQSSPATIFAAILAGILVGAQDPNAGAAIIYGSTAAMMQSQINFTRQNEYEADRVGIKVMRDAGVNPMGMADFFATLLEKSESNNVLAQMEYLRTHPLSSTRIAEARHRIKPNDKALPVDSLDFQLSKSRLLIATSPSIPDTLERLKAIPVQQQNIVSQYSLAIAYTAHDQPKKAITILTKLVKQYEHPWLKLSLAHAYKANKQPQKALDKLHSLHQLYPGYTPVSIAYAKLLTRAGRHHDAIKTLKYLLQSKQQAIIYQTLAQAYYSNGQISAALEATSHQYELEGYLKLAIQQIDNALNQPGLKNGTRQRLTGRKTELTQQLRREMGDKN